MMSFNFCIIQFIHTSIFLLCLKNVSKFNARKIIILFQNFRFYLPIFLTLAIKTIWSKISILPLLKYNLSASYGTATQRLVDNMTSRSTSWLKQDSWKIIRFIGLPIQRHKKKIVTLIFTIIFLIRKIAKHLINTV